MKPVPSIWKARIYSLIILIGSFLFFNWTLHNGFFPGESARQVSVALGAEPGTLLVEYDKVNVLTPEEAHSIGPGKELLNVDTKFAVYRSKYVLWRTVSRAVASLDFGDKAKLLNTFSAVCGALAVMLAFMVFRCLPLFRAFHALPLSAKMKKRSTYLAGFIGAIALMTSVPFWLSATRFLPNTFEVLLVLLAAWALLSASIKHSLWWLAFFGMLIGISVFECDTGFFLIPFWLVFTIGAMKIGEINDMQSFIHLLFGIAAGMVIYLVLANSLLAGEVESLSVLLPFKELYSTLDRAYLLVFGGGFYETPRLLLNLFFGIIPFVAVAAMYMWRASDQAHSSGGFLFFVLACTSSIAMTSTSVSPWGTVSNDTGIFFPTTIYLLNAFVVSYLTAQGAFMAGGRVFPPKARRYRDDDRDDDFRDSPVGRLLMFYIAGFTCLSALCNYSEIQCWNDTLVSKFAAKVSEKLDGRSWLLSRNGKADSMIKLHATLQGKPLTVFCIDDSASENIRFKSLIVPSNPVFRDLDTDFLRESLSATNSTVFAETWISSDTNIASKVLVEQADDFAAAGIRAVPNIATYRAMTEGENIDWVSLSDEHIAFWKEIAGTAPLRSKAPIWLRHQRTWIRHYEHVMSKALAEGLRKNGDHVRAMEILKTADELLKD